MVVRVKSSVVKRWESVMHRAFEVVLLLSILVSACAKPDDLVDAPGLDSSSTPGISDSDTEPSDDEPGDQDPADDDPTDPDTPSDDPPDADTDVVDDDTDVAPTDSAVVQDTDPPLPPLNTNPLRRHDCSGMDPADAGPLGGWVALTFDDGPDVIDTPDIMDVLRRYQVPATFFVLGERLTMSSTWDIVDEIVADPLFDLANHSWDHPGLTSVSSWELASQIDDTTDIIDTFGVQTEYFRFPYGDSNCATHDEVTSRGLNVAGWHIDTADWCYAALGTTGVCEVEDYWRIPTMYEADMRGFIVEQARRYDGGVVLFHDVHSWTAAVLEDVILDLLADGFTFTSLDDTNAFPNLVAGTPVDIPYLGEACDTLDDLCFHAEYFAWCEPVEPSNPANRVGVCTMPCDGYCLDRDGAEWTFCAEVSPGAGQCIGRAGDRNDWCADLPDTVRMTVDRYVGTSGAATASREVCAPASW
jgi:peptidoglycan/xylan/chitin deacetylase (PgdA/CDA1 family)